jgi:hypothetical protein
LWGYPPSPLFSRKILKNKLLNSKISNNKDLAAGIACFRPFLHTVVSPVSCQRALFAPLLAGSDRRLWRGAHHCLATGRLLLSRVAGWKSVTGARTICDEKIRVGIRHAPRSLGEDYANKIFFGIQQCTYNVRTDNKRKRFGDFQQVKWGLTRCDILRATCEGVRLMTGWGDHGCAWPPYTSFWT